MQSLYDIQKNFSNAILQDDPLLIIDALSSNKIDVSDACQIYINNVNLTLSEFLSHYFPAIWSLLGEKCASAFAIRYIKFYPPKIKNFEKWPENFPKFLSKQRELGMLSYLKDVALLEWAQSKAYTAKNVESLSAEAINRILSKSDETCLYIKLEPAFQLLQLTYQADKIIKTALNENSDELEIHPSKFYYSISRLNNRTFIEEINKNIYTFLNVLQKESIFKAVISSNINEEQQFKIFSKLIQNKQIISVREVK